MTRDSANQLLLNALLKGLAHAIRRMIYPLHNAIADGST
jgi:hypothetical protein